jgi:hypothetical protein
MVADKLHPPPPQIVVSLAFHGKNWKVIETTFLKHALLLEGEKSQLIVLSKRAVEYEYENCNQFCTYVKEKSTPL